MSTLQNNKKKTRRLIKLASGSLFLGAMVGLSGQATAANYTVMGSGAEVREALTSLNAMEKPAELKCGAKETKTVKNKAMKAADKAAEAKCGEGKCGGEMKKAAQKTSEKAVKNQKIKDSKAAEAKCGEGKCGGDMKSKKDVKNSAKTVKEAKTKKAESKTSEAKCGEGKCGS